MTVGSLVAVTAGAVVGMEGTRVGAEVAMGTIAVGKTAVAGTEVAG